jgi:hypothetical protein
MPDIFRFVLVIILLTIGLIAYLLVVTALFPQRTGKTKSVIQSTAVRSLGIGLVNFLFFAVIPMALLSVAENGGPLFQVILTIPAVFILSILGIILSMGLSAMATFVGERLFPDLAAWKQTLWGTVCLTLACAVPFVGWFLLLPYVGFVGIGAVILGFFQREK